MERFLETELETEANGGGWFREPLKSNQPLLPLSKRIYAQTLR
jgi:hypothetical protein